MGHLRKVVDGGGELAFGAVSAEELFGCFGDSGPVDGDGGGRGGHKAEKARVAHLLVEDVEETP